MTKPHRRRLQETIRRLMEENYDLGRLTRVQEIVGGYCNKSYAVWMAAGERTGRFFLRMFNPNGIEIEILFEHALLNHLRSNGFTPRSSHCSQPKRRNGAHHHTV